MVYYYWRAAISTAAKSPAEEAVSEEVHQMEQHRQGTHLATDFFFLRRPFRPQFLNRGFSAGQRADVKAEIGSSGTATKPDSSSPSFPKKEETRMQRLKTRGKRILRFPS